MTLRGGVLTLALFLASAAGAQELTITPGWACTGDRLVLQWTGAGTSLVRLEETVGASTRVDTARGRSGRAERTLQGTTVFHLSSGAPGSWSRIDTVSAHPESMTHNLHRPAPTCAGRLSLTSMAIPPARASDRIRARSVTNQGTEPIYILHRGRSTRLAPGESTTLFNDTPFSGDWGVIVDTGEFNKACPAGGTVPAPEIRVEIITVCG